MKERKSGGRKEGRKRKKEREERRKRILIKLGNKQEIPLPPREKQLLPIN